MTDIDFDELDKAVNHLMTTADVADEASTPALSEATSSQQVATVPSPVQADDSFVRASTDSSRDPEAIATTNSSAAPLAVKRRGQFMDIVHPGVGKPAPVPIARQGVTVQPVDTDLAAAKPSASPKTDAVSSDVTPLDMESTGAAFTQDTPSPAEPILPAIASDSDSSETAVLPPTEIQQSDSTQTVDELSVFAEHDTVTATDDANSSAPEMITDEVLAEVATKTVDEPLVSPFLPDAQVEKRPLGSPVALPDPLEIPVSSSEAHSVATDSTRSEDETTKQSDEMATADSSDSQAGAEPVQEESVATPLPAELNKDIMALESADTNPVSHAAEAEELAAGNSVTTSNASVQPPAGGSIAQQYSEQPSSGDQTSGAIYDTATYHKGVEAPVVKKTSKLTWLIWALVLVIVGAAAGAGYFYWSTHF